MPSYGELELSSWLAPAETLAHGYAAVCAEVERQRAPMPAVEPERPDMPPDMRYAEAQHALALVKLDEHGKPDRKMPDCPRCEEDELWGTRRHDGSNDFSCYRCSWRYVVQRNGLPQPAVEPRPAELTAVEPERCACGTPTTVHDAECPLYDGEHNAFMRGLAAELDCSVLDLEEFAVDSVKAPRSTEPAIEPRPAELTAEDVVRVCEQTSQPLAARVVAVHRYVAQRAEAAERERDDANREQDDARRESDRQRRRAEAAERERDEARQSVAIERAMALAAQKRGDEAERKLAELTDIATDVVDDPYEDAELKWKLRAVLQRQARGEAPAQPAGLAEGERGELQLLRKQVERYDAERDQLKSDLDAARARERALREAAREVVDHYAVRGQLIRSYTLQEDVAELNRLLEDDSLAATPDSAPAAHAHDAATELERAADAVAERWASADRDGMPATAERLRAVERDLRARAAALRGGEARAACGECERLTRRATVYRAALNKAERTLTDIRSAADRDVNAPSAGQAGEGGGA